MVKNTKVSDGKSALLEVQISPLHKPQSYAWSKDGPVLTNSRSEPQYDGVNRPILFIDHADHEKEGNYECHVKCIGKEVSIEIKLTVIYPPEKKHLIYLYSRCTELPRDTWPPVSTNTFIHLALIKRGNMEDTYDYTIQGNLDDILSRKEEAPYEQVFNQYESGALILIEGRPGSGKTTLVHKITRDWATKGNVLRKAKLVFLISLRSLTFHNNDNSLRSILGQFYNEAKTQIILNDIEGTDGKGIVFIMDGLDEYNKSRTIVHQLLNQRLFPLAMVIVASRPVASARLRNSGSLAKHVEVLGFTKENINSYTESYPFKCRGMHAELKTYLWSHPNVSHLCYLPVHAAMICFLYSKLGKDIPCTETKVYEKFTILLILRSIKRISSNEGARLASFQDLTGIKKNQFHELCKLAFGMTINGNQVVCREAPLAESDDPSLGLVTIDSIAQLFGYEDMYTFLHLTFQEYLAAVHITSLCDFEQNEMITLYSGRRQMRKVWTFYCGMVDFDNKQKRGRKIICHTNKDSHYGVQCAYESQQSVMCDIVVKSGIMGNLTFRDHILTSVDFNAIGYVISTTTHVVDSLTFDKCKLSKEDLSILTAQAGRKLRYVRHLTLQRCGIKDLMNVLKTLPGLHALDLYKMDVSRRSVLLLTNNITLPELKILRLPKRLLRFGVAALKLFQFKSTALEKVSSSYYNLEDEQSNNLLNAFGFCASHIPTDLKLCNIFNPKFSLVTPGMFSHCASMSLINCNIDDGGLTMLAGGMKNSLNLQELILDFNKISDHGAQVLARIFTSCNKLKVFSAQCNVIDNLGAISLANELRNCSELVELNLQCNSFGLEGLVAIVKALNKFSGKVKAHLYSPKISEEGLRQILQYQSKTSKYSKAHMMTTWDFIIEGGLDAAYMALECCTHSIQLQLQFNKIICNDLFFLPVSAGILIDAHRLEPSLLAGRLKCCQHLKKLAILHVSFQDTIMVYTLVEGLQSSKLLQKLDISKNHFSISCFSAITRSLSQFTNLKTLKLSYITFSDNQKWEYLQVLEINLPSIANLEHLDLSGNALYSTGAIILAKILASCKCLKKLSLSNNEIIYEGVAAIADLLQSSKNITEINLSYNSISSKGAAMLAESAMSNKNLEEINLAHNWIGYGSTDYHIPQVISVQSLDLSYNDICSGKAFVSTELKYCTSLQSLDLSNTCLSSFGAMALSEGLKHCTTLRTLNLSHNLIDLKGMAALSYAFTRINLTSLNISSNSIGSDGAAALTRGIKRWSALKSLNMSSNHITSDGLAILADGIARTSLVDLDISNNSIDSAGALPLADMLQNCSLECLNISRNSIDSLGASTLAGGLTFCCTLKSFNISFNSINVNGAILLADGLKHCRSLEKLNISMNGLDPEANVRFADRLKCCKSLKICF